MRLSAEVAEGELLWEPDQAWRDRTHLTAYLRWLERERGLRFADYAALWEWSVSDLPAFWQSIWDYFGVRASAPARCVLADRSMPGARWFPGAELNYAEHALSGEHRGGAAVLWAGEHTPLGAMSWQQFAGAVRVLATRLRELGVRPGDRVVAYLPNIPHTLIAMLATTSIGAVWAACSPDFGATGALDRFGQLEPTVLFAVDGYRYGGVERDRRDEVRALARALPGLRHVVSVRYLYPDQPVPADTLDWERLLDHPGVGAEEFSFEQVPFDHPLWILFSSGTTGPPKAIVHGHGGILLEQLKLHHFHMDLHEGDRLFFYSTTGWMMWNFLASSLLAGAVPVLYDGSPTHPDVDVLWRLAEEAEVSCFGASPSYVDLIDRAGLAPGERFELTALRTVVPAGSPVSAECTAWFYRNVKRRLWVATGSGGTDCCTGFVGGVPTLPVRAGEIQARSLGVAAHAFDDSGRPVTGQVGELVLTEPLPSMPVRFWGDDDGSRYRASYFEHFPGVWRHGDFFLVNERGGCFVLGRSDATLNRHGVRIGTAEIYRALDELAEIDNALVVNLHRPGGGFHMPLFVTLTEGTVLDDALRAKINDQLRHTRTPRHVPDEIVAVPAIPMTISGKKLEIPVRRILQGEPVEQVADRSALADPSALDAFVEYARNQPN
ncbi:acetoacetate--CoA ligase [Saccharomonospora marina]|uniref:acetoacetate--CoA ligase n=1 Tax=Saccharomonospora marina TaxID=632569 RepID=UPI0012FBD533|nr:acetoacetate--CoA ligase [Saccharomonospora marina]